MSEVQYKTMIVTSTEQTMLNKAREKAIEIFGESRVSESLSGSVGAAKTFMISPSGSKEGWVKDIVHKGNLMKYEDYLNKRVYSTDLNDNSLKYVIVSYGDYGARIETTNQIDRACQHYLVTSPHGGIELGCLWDSLGKDGKALLEERDVILISSPPESCSHCYGTTNKNSK